MAKKTRKPLTAVQEALEADMNLTAAWGASDFLRENPEDLEALSMLGNAKALLGERKAARDIFERAVGLAVENDKDFFQGRLAMTLVLLGDFRRAEEILRAVVTSDPDLEGAWVDLIQLFRVEGNNSEAMSVAREAIKLCKGDDRADVLKEAAELLASVGQEEEAFALVDTGLGLAPKDDDLVSLRADLVSLFKAQGRSVPGTPSGAAAIEEQPPKGTGVLTAHIEREYFAAIVDGTKKIEYRTASEYWQKRIQNAGPTPITLRLINGMKPDSPELSVVVDEILLNIWSNQYEIHLGEILAVKNWPT